MTTPKKNVAEFSVDTGALLREIARNFSGGGTGDAPGIVMSCREIQKGLVRIAQRAIELGDPVLLAELRRLGCVRSGDAP